MDFFSLSLFISFTVSFTLSFTVSATDAIFLSVCDTMRLFALVSVLIRVNTELMPVNTETIIQNYYYTSKLLFLVYSIFMQN